jgi:hypothetical protein
MSPISLGFEISFFVLVAVAWAWYFRAEIARWRRERGPRRQLAREAAAEREAELARLRDELAEKYLGDMTAKSPTPGE